MAAGDAKAIPVKNTALRITFPIFDADGDCVTGATGLDSEISKDGGTFADCTNEATEIATASGMYYLDLTSTEMNADTVAIIVKTSTAGAKTTPIVLYTAARSINDLAWPTTTGRSMDVDASGGVEVGSFQTGAITAAAFAAGAIDANAIATDAIGSAELAASAVTEIQSGLATAAALATVQADTDDIQTRLPAALVTGRMDASVGAMASGVVTSTAIAADAIGASELAADAVTEIADGVLSRALSNVEGSATFRSLAGVIAKLTNRFAIAGGTATIYKTDDTTAYATQSVVTDAAADPVIEVNTV